MTQYLAEVDPAAEEILVTARVLMSAVMELTTDLSVEGIALVTGLTKEVVRDILNSKTYQRVIEDQLKLLVSGTLARGVKQLDKIVTGKATDANKIAAHRANVMTFQVIMDAQTGVAMDSSNQKVKDALKVLADMGQKNRESK